MCDTREMPSASAACTADARKPNPSTARSDVRRTLIVMSPFLEPRSASRPPLTERRTFADWFVVAFAWPSRFGHAKSLVLFSRRQPRQAETTAQESVDSSCRINSDEAERRSRLGSVDSMASPMNSCTDDAQSARVARRSGVQSLETRKPDCRLGASSAVPSRRLVCSDPIVERLRRTSRWV